MKKLLSIFLALSLVFTLGICAFAAEGDAEAEEEAVATAATIELPEFLQGAWDFIKGLLANVTGFDEIDVEAALANVLDGVDYTDLMGVLGQTFSSIGGGLGDLLGGAEIGGLDVGGGGTDAIAGVFDMLMGGLETLGIDTNALTDALANSAIFNFFAKLYTFGAEFETTTEAPPPTDPPLEETEPDNPPTGSPAYVGLTAFAVISVAAAAAFAARKKED